MNRIEEQARYYSNIPLRDRNIKAVVHLEDTEDIAFWDYQLQIVSPARYLFVPFSKNEKGNDTRGCEQCLRYKPYLSKRFFICIDSDLRILRGETGLTAHHHIAQTYTYAWENHRCEAEHLQHRFAALAPGTGFDLQAFLTHLSAVVYQPLIYLVAYSQDAARNKLWNVSKFNACLPLQPPREELADNGKAYIERISQLFAESLQGLQPPTTMSNVHFDHSNAYLHIQGHQLYKLILHIGTMLCRGKKVAFKSDILDKAFPTGGYTEINHAQADLRYITSST